MLWLREDCCRRFAQSLMAHMAAEPRDGVVDLENEVEVIENLDPEDLLGACMLDV